MRLMHSPTLPSNHDHWSTGNFRDSPTPVSMMLVFHDSSTGTHTALRDMQ